MERKYVRPHDIAMKQVLIALDDMVVLYHTRKAPIIFSN